VRWLWDAFHSLSAGRQRGYGTFQPISVSEITSYASFLRLSDPDDREDLMHFVHFMDGIWMGVMDKRTSASNKPPPK